MCTHWYKISTTLTGEEIGVCKKCGAAKSFEPTPDEIKQRHINAFADIKSYSLRSKYVPHPCEDAKWDGGWDNAVKVVENTR